MPWLDVLRELVGYTKYAQSLMPDPVSAPLEEMRRLCALASAPLEEQLAHGRNDAVVTLLKNSEVVRPTPGAAQVELALPRAPPKRGPGPPAGGKAVQQLLDALSTVY
jgi:hypothetical protein